MVTRDILRPTIDTFLDVVVKKNFTPRGSNENALYIISTGNVSVTRSVIPLVSVKFTYKKLYTVLLSLTHEKLSISAKTQFLTVNILSLEPTK